MIMRILLLLLALGPLSAPLHAGWFDGVMSYFGREPAAVVPKVRVLVVHDQQGVILEVKGKYKIHDAYTGEHISTRFVGKRKFIQAVRDGIKWGEEFPGIFQLVIIPDEKSTTTIVDGIEYHGPVYVYDIGETISIVNDVGIEDFLASVLSQRYREETLPEVLAALAITARTATYNAIMHPRSPYWSVDGRQAGYQGSAAVDLETDMQRAIHDTRYMVMSTVSPDSSKLNPFPAQWSDGMQGLTQGQQVLSKISLAEAEAVVKKGGNAAQVLAKAFPGTKIEFIHDPLDKK